MRRLACAFGLLSVATFGVVLAPSIASAHAQLITPTRRLLNDGGGGIKGAAAPCGMAKPTTPANTFTVGDVVMVQIHENIDHPGHYELWWSNDNDATFTVVAGMDNIANPTGLQAVDTKVAFTMPSAPCDNCTLQMRMVMTEVPAAPTDYYSCADIRLAPVGADLAGVSGTDDAGSTDPADMAVAAGTDDAGTTSHPTDMASKPPAPSASLPGCSVGGDGAMFSLFALLLAVAVIPSLQRARRRR